MPIGLPAVPRFVRSGVSTAERVLRVPMHPVAQAAGRWERRVWSRAGRVHIEVRGIHRPGAETLIETLEAALLAIEGVEWAEANPVVGRVVVACDPALEIDDLVREVERVESEAGVEPGDRLDDGTRHPAEDDPLRWGRVEVAADVGGIVLGGFARFLRLPTVAVEVAAVLPGLEVLPPVRAFLRPRPALEAAMVSTNALLLGLTHGPLGLVADGFHRATLLSENRARRAAWERLEPRLHPAPRAERIVPVAREARPVPFPDGPLEEYARRVAAASITAAGVAFLSSLNPRRAADVVVAGIPRAARLGREAFAAQATRVLSGRDVVVMDERALRILDRVDTVVVDDALIATGRGTLGETVVFEDVDEATVRSRLAELFEPEHPLRTAHDGEWTLARLAVPETAHLLGPEQRARLLGTDSGNRAVLVLRRGDVAVALAGVQPELRGGARELAHAIRGAAHDLVIAGGPDRSALAGLLGADAVRPGGEHLTETVRTLQAEGRVVALVTGRGASAHLAADCGIGVLGTHDTPWGADFLCPSLGAAVLVVEATVTARAATDRAVKVAAAGSAIAGVLAFGPMPLAARRATTATSVAVLSALGVGTWTGMELARRPVVHTFDSVDWHALPSDRVLERLGTTTAGLSADEVAKRQVDHVEAVSVPGFATVVVEELSNPLTAVLGLGAALSVAVGSFADGLLVAGGLVTSAAVGATQRIRTERAIDELSAALSDRRTQVRRDGVLVETAPTDVVPGDIVVLRAGDTVPADCRVLGAAALEVDESSLTGESLPVTKRAGPVPAGTAVGDRRSMVYAGTGVAVGEAETVAVAVGPAVEARRGLAAGERPPPTGVEVRLRQITDRVVPAVLAAGAGLVVNGLLRGRPTREAIATGVSLAAAAVPEGLPFLATVAQASAARRLSTRGVLVRNPGVLEALGRVDVLCFDKTGTLTKGRLEVRAIDDGASVQHLPLLTATHRGVLVAAVRATPVANGERLPHPTDQAVVDAAEDAGLAGDESLTAWDALHALPFEPSTGYHAVLGVPKVGDEQVVAVKGAPEVVLARCVSWRRGGVARPLDLRERAHLHRRADALARLGLRVLAVAEARGTEHNRLSDDRVSGLDFVGFVGIADSARGEAQTAVAEMLAAGISVVMVTGDHRVTAEAVAADLGLLVGEVVTGPELDRLDDEELDGRIEGISVFARVTPAHKVRIVRAFQRAGRVVAMTGDGANDAQAIRLADIGVAFGSRATPAARDAADLVVAQGDVTAIIQAISEGRAMWAAVRNGLALLLGGNLGEVVFTTGAALVSGASPLNPRQLLAVNLLTDLAPALAIATQPPRSADIDVRREGPEASLGPALVRDIGIRAAATAAGATGAWIVGRATGTQGRASTIALVSLVGTQLGQTLVVGRHQPVVAASAIGSTAVLFVIVQTPGLSQFFGCRPLGPVGWGIAAWAATLGTAGAVVAGAVADWRWPIGDASPTRGGEVTG